MVKNPGETPGAGTIRLLNLPVPADIEEDERQKPIALTLRRQRLKVTSLEDLWEIDEEWWRTTPIARRYYKMTLEDGRRVTVFRDLADGRWYRQQY